MMRVLIWGAGSGAYKYLEGHMEMLDYIDIPAVIDGQGRNGTNEYFRMPNGKKIKKILPEQISNYQYDYIVVLSSYFDEIRDEAQYWKINNEKILQGAEFYILWVGDGYWKFKQKYSIWLKYINYDITGEKSDYVWVFWLQGYEAAPELVQKCIESIKKYSEGLNFQFITMQNYKDYIEVPDYIICKLEAGIITPTFFSDILRLLLLDKYGGFWLDATIFCLGDFKRLCIKEDFFMFHITDKNDGRIASSWFIYAKRGHILVKKTLHLLLRYCMEMERMEHYYIFHFFFRMAAESCESEWSKVPAIEVTDCYLLLQKINDEFDIEELQKMARKMPIQKLNRRRKIDKSKRDTYYYYITSKREM